MLMKITDKKFLERLVKNGDCLEYKYCLDSRGYGRLHRRHISNTNIRASRYAFYLEHGYFPEKFVCHTCDNPSCVNPAHLFEGSHDDNMADMVKKRRHISNRISYVGEKNPNSKLSSCDVEKIKHLLNDGFANTKIAALFGITHQMVSRIKHGKAWC